MEYFHVIIKNVSKLTKATDIIVAVNRSEEDIKEKIAKYYNNGEEFIFKGRKVDPNYVEIINISKSTEALKKFDEEFVPEAFKEGNSLAAILDHLDVEDVTELFINGQPATKAKPTLHQPIEQVSPNENVRMKNNDEKKNHDFFISYIWCTGFRYALHLRENAYRIHRNAFLDKIDLPNVAEENEEFRIQIDKAIESSPNFVLIMTRRFNESPEVIREYEKAQNGKKIWRFKQKNLGKNDLTCNSVDFANKHYIEFTDEFDLLTKVDEALSGELKPNTFFEKDVKALIESEGFELRQANDPFIEVIVGPIDEKQEWLSFEDEDLLNRNPYVDNFSSVKAYKDFFELEARSQYTSKRLLRIKNNGFFHLIEPIYYRNEFFIDNIFNQASDMLLYCIMVMRQKNVRAHQSVYIRLNNVHGLEAKVEPHQLSFPKWFFPRSDPDPFIISFDPSADWSKIGQLLLNLYTEFCHSISYNAPTSAEFKERLATHLSRQSYYVRYSLTYHRLGQTMKIPAINISDLQLSDH
jgi:hypothetical protein